MGSSPSKEGNMESYSQTASHVDTVNKNNNGGDLKATEDSKQEHATRKDDVCGARVAVEEPKTTAKGIKIWQNNCKTILVMDFKGKTSNLTRCFHKYEADIKRMERVDWENVTVEFKSRQVAAKILKDPPRVEGKVLKLSLLDDINRTKEEKISEDQGKVQAMSTAPEAELENQRCPGLSAAERISKRTDSNGQENASKELANPEVENNERWQDEEASSTMTEMVIPGMQIYIDNDKEESNNSHIPKGTNKSAKATVADDKEQMASETAIELDAVKVEFIQKVHRKMSDNVCANNNVVIVLEAGSLSCNCNVIFRKNTPGNGNVERACTQFLDLYQSISDKLSKSNIINVLTELPECTIQCLKDALTHAESNERVLVKNCLSDDFQIVFYGSEHDVESAMATFMRRSRKQRSEQDRGKSPDNTFFKQTVGEIEVSVCRGDVTRQKVDVVVNAANSELKHIGGVALAIREAGGRRIQEESRDHVMRHGTLKIGQAMHTGAGDMDCKYVIHTVGPIWSRHDKATAKTHLRQALTNVLHYACDKLQARSIAVPAISAGIYGMPVEVCAEQLMLATLMFVQSPPFKNRLHHIMFVNIDDQVNRAFVRVFSGSFSSNFTGDKSSEPSNANDCPICLDKAVRPIRLYCCGKEFCSDCIEQAFNSKPVCPTCSKQHGALKGTQTEGGWMEVQEFPESLPGYPECGMIQIHYVVPTGIQEDCHPNPGRPYKGADRDAYLPDNKEGRKILQLLKKAFENRLVFTVGTSATTGQTDVVTWNDIHHKTSIDGSFGYPDPDYLRRVREELAAKGIR